MAENERLAAPGPRGQQGVQGDRGEQGPQGEPLSRKVVRALLFLFAFAVALAVLGLYWNNHQAGQIQQAVAQNNRRWCATLTLFTESEQKTPPTTSSGRNLAADFAALYREFGCG
jgi:hypothetical protein